MQNPVHTRGPFDNDDLDDINNKRIFFLPVISSTHTDISHNTNTTVLFAYLLLPRFFSVAHMDFPSFELLVVLKKEGRKKKKGDERKGGD